MSVKGRQVLRDERGAAVTVPKEFCDAVRWEGRDRNIWNRLVMSIEEALQRAGSQLAAAGGTGEGEARAREVAFRAFMKILPEQVSEISADGGPSKALAAWASAHVAQLGAARDALTDWAMSLGRLLYDGSEEKVERTLEQRTELALLEQLFQGTEASEWLGGYMDEETDRDHHEAALGWGIWPEPWVPRSHWWWCWRDDAEAQ